ncbi:hypothetical protein KQI77_08725 [Clostridium sp. MSJ-8]|uniref:hypothetical protein n=1 Tax=Clostridium sp. MSJ-8 TaxID=2841510 RepID=UPI001C0E9371|nr:hypothetical protein [Clostridium sp. MSJ-8]MBU5488216.1 hypothetical protein [Clostridium sp. MSJ-8]
MIQIKHRIKVTIMICIIFISVSLNVFLAVSNYQYKYRTGRESYNNILSVRTLNETNNDMLKNILEIGKIGNADLLKLYTNYNTISENISSLWYEYSNYKNDRALFTSTKDIDTNDALIGEVNSRITEYLKNILELEMETQNFEMILDGDIKTKFTEILYVSDATKEFFEKFSDEHLKGLEGEKRVKSIIKNKYWIDILENLNKIDQQYVDVDFSMPDDTEEEQNDLTS